MPVYTMNCFKIPKGICEEINGVLSKYWWSKGTDRRAMHWIAWKRMGLPKKEGGLGFRDLEGFNVALLAKQVWRILESPDSLVARLLRGRYFPSSNILEAGAGYKPSFIWTSLMEGRVLLKKGLRYLIGDGKSINIWRDPWIPTHLTTPPQLLDGVETELQTVDELLIAGSQRWNRALLESLFIEADVQEILKIKVSSLHTPDLLGWHYTKSGIYSVKSGYWLQTHLSENGIVEPPPGMRAFKEAIWKLKIAPKLRHFLGSNWD